MKTLRLIFLFLILVFVGVISSKCSASAGLVGNKAPEINVKAWLNTKPITLKELQDKIVVLEFWATWCPPCRKSIPHLIELYRKYKDKGVVIVSITDESKDEVEGFVRSNGMEYPVGTGGTTSRIYGVRGIPHAFIIDDEGIIVWEGHPMSGLGDALEKEVKKLEPKRKISKQTEELWVKGREYMESDNYQAAIKCFLEATENDPNYSAPYYRLGLCYEKIGYTEGALNYYNKYLELTEADPKKEDTRDKVRQNIKRLKSSEHK